MLLVETIFVICWHYLIKFKRKSQKALTILYGSSILKRKRGKLFLNYSVRPQKHNCYGVTFIGGQRTCTSSCRKNCLNSSFFLWTFAINQFSAVYNMIAFPWYNIKILSKTDIYARLTDLIIFKVIIKQEQNMTIYFMVV